MIKHFSSKKTKLAMLLKSNLLVVPTKMAGKEHVTNLQCPEKLTLKKKKKTL